MKERLLEFVRHTGMPVYQFEKVCGLSNAYIKNISKGIGADKLEKILSQFPQLNRVWLLTGNGDMLLPSATNVSTGDNIHHNSGNVATHGAHITNITTTPTTPAMTIPATPASDNDKDRLIAQLQAQITALQAQLDAQHEHTDLLQALQTQIATLQSQIAELKADKQNLMQLLTNLTQNK